MTINSKYSVRIFIVIGFVFLINFFKNEIMVYGWQKWIGKEIYWHGINLPIEKDHFVFPDGDSTLFPVSDERTVILGKFDTSKSAFPSENYLIIGVAKFDINRLSEAFSKLCKKIKCTAYEEYFYTENDMLVTCIQFIGTSKALDNRQFHVFCKVQASNILVEYHGSQLDFDKFKTQQQLILKSIATQSNFAGRGLLSRP